ncbi:MAG: sugar nucleotide-binding protein [Planctomycetota bacterium]
MPPQPHETGDSKRLLITGIAGFLGRHLAQRAARDGWDVVGIVRSMPNTTYTTVRADLAEPVEVRDALEQVAPDAAIHCAAAARTNECERFPEVAERDNARASDVVARACGDAAIPLVLCSTDLVFAGDRVGHLHAEDDPVSPVNVYGRSKLEAERRTHDAYPAAIIARLPLLFGPPAADGAPGSFLTGWVEHARAGTALALFTDEFRTPLSARDAAAGLLLALGRGAAGRTYHLAGPERVSRYELGRRFAAVAAESLGFEADLFTPGLQSDVAMPAPRAPDVSLDGSRAMSELGFAPASLDDELRWTAVRMA